MENTDDTPGADVMIGSRYIAGGAIEGWPLRRHLILSCVSYQFRAEFHQAHGSGLFTAQTATSLSRTSSTSGSVPW